MDARSPGCISRTSARAAFPFPFPFPFEVEGGKGTGRVNGEGAGDTDGLARVGGGGGGRLRAADLGSRTSDTGLFKSDDEDDALSACIVESTVRLLFEAARARGKVPPGLGERGGASALDFRPLPAASCSKRDRKLDTARETSSWSPMVFAKTCNVVRARPATTRFRP